MISVLMVSFNTKDLTIRSIDTLLANTSERIEVIVVDNNSSDGSANAVADHFPDVTLIRSDENLGFGRACNLGAQSARGAYLLLLNPDTEVLPGAIDQLLLFAQSAPQARIWGGRTIYGDGTLNPASCWRQQSVWGLLTTALGLASAARDSAWLNPEGYGGWSRDSIREVDIVSGCFMLIERNLWDRLSGFDPVFFMYGEDADLCIRARQFGARPMITPDATIIHHSGASEPVRADKIVRLYRAKIQLMERHWSPLASQLGRGLIKLNVLRRRLLFDLKRRWHRAPAEADNPFMLVWSRRAEWS